MIKKIKNKFQEIDGDLGIDERSKELYCISALFDSPDTIFHAADKIHRAGYTDYDVHTPYPIHGMDDAMRLKPTKLGQVTFAFGLMGTIAALTMIAYMSGFDYKNIIGGKPFFSLPPSIPVTFEVTVLLAAIFTIIFTLFIFNKLPKLNHPLIDTEYMKRVSSDSYGIIIKTTDAKFNIEEVTGLFKELGAYEINAVYKFIADESKIKTPIFDLKFIVLLAVISVFTSVGVYLLLNKVIYAVPFDWMTVQAKVNPQSESKFFKDGYGMRNPVEGTVSRGHFPYEFKGMSDSVVENISNPLPITESVLEKGKQKFNTFCSPCHGNYGKGDSRLNGQFPNPPTLHSEKVRNWKDANIYHVIMNGQNIMPSYAKQTTDEERWAIIHYIRVLQRSQNPLETDFKNEK